MNASSRNPQAIDNDGRLTILCFPTVESSLKEMLHVCKQLQASNRYRCSFLVGSCSDKWLDRARHDGHEVRYLRGKRQEKSTRDKSPRNRAGSPTATRRRRPLKGLLALVSRLISWILEVTFLDALVRIPLYMADLRKNIRTANRILDEVQPRVMLTTIDSGIGVHAMFIMAARRRGIPTLVVPYATWEPNAFVFARKGRADRSRKVDMRRAINRLAARWYPTHVIRDGDNKLLATRGERILAAWLLGVLPPHPGRCYAGCELAARVAVEGARNWDILRGCQVPAELLTITGRASTDEIYRILENAPEHRRHICANLGISADRRLVLFSIPQLAEQGFCGWPQHLREMEFVIETLASLSDVNVVLSLHPTSKAADYADIAHRHGAVIAKDHPIEHLMPASDLFLSAFSSTTVMAMGCGVPAINVDFYGMHYGLFNDCQGVLTVVDKAQLAPVMQRILGDAAYYAELVAQQHASATSWMKLDGRCGERLLGEVDKLAGYYAPAASRHAA